MKYTERHLKPSGSAVDRLKLLREQPSDSKGFTEIAAERERERASKLVARKSMDFWTTESNGLQTSDVDDEAFEHWRNATIKKTGQHKDQKTTLVEGRVWTK